MGRNNNIFSEEKSKCGLLIERNTHIDIAENISGPRPLSTRFLNMLQLVMVIGRLTKSRKCDVPYIEYLLDFAIFFNFHTSR